MHKKLAKNGESAFKKCTSDISYIDMSFGVHVCVRRRGGVGVAVVWGAAFRMSTMQRLDQYLWTYHAMQTYKLIVS